MYLATVTCNRDFQQMLLQAESIQRFLHPCKHVIIINEEYADIDFWNKWLQPYYKNHELLIIPKIYHEYPIIQLGPRDRYGDLNKNYQNWTSHQLQKMLLAYHFDDDYLLLDSKNFFIKETSISEWDNVIGNNNFQEFEEVINCNTTYKKYAELFGREIEYFISPYTPFKIKREPLTSKCSLSELAYKLFYPIFHSLPIYEGIFYSFFVEDEINKQHAINQVEGLQRDSIIWEHSNDLILKLNKIILHPDIKVMGIHRDVLSAITEHELKIINVIINRMLALTNKIYPMPKYLLHI